MPNIKEADITNILKATLSQQKHRLSEVNVVVQELCHMFTLNM